MENFWSPALNSLPLAIVVAYYLMPVMLVYALYKGRDVPFHWMFLVFGLFLSVCGTAYAIQTWQISHPHSWMGELFKSMTVLVGGAIALLVLALMPIALALPSPARLEATNLALQKEISDRQRAEAALETLAVQLEEKVEERTKMLLQANTALKKEIRERTAAETSLRHSEAQLRQEHQMLQTTLRELQDTQAQLVQAEKMSSLGQLVAGIAHEINNPINFIFGNLKHLELYAQDLLKIADWSEKNHLQTSHLQDFMDLENIDLEFLREDMTKLLGSMRIGTERIRQIVLSMRNFSRLDHTEMKPVDIHEGLDSTLLILQHRLKGNSDSPAIELIKNYGSLPLVYCYPGQLNQVFMNILSNAIDALIEKQLPSNPTIQIKTKIQGRNALIQIADNGPGIAAAVRHKLFDPFFTTKPIGKGTGLGLYISYQIIVDKHRGQIDCWSSPEEGTAFLIEIPIAGT